MAAEKSSKKKLTPRQGAFIQNLAKGASQSKAAKDAGYSTRNLRQSAHQTLKQVQGKMPEIMDQLGFTDQSLIDNYLRPALEAEETRYVSVETKRVKVPNWGTRMSALDAAFKLKGSTLFWRPGSKKVALRAVDPPN
jgi:phage terminase small subunit